MKSEPTEKGTYRLTPRMEACIKGFGEALEHIPEEEFWANLPLDTNRDRPVRWTNDPPS